MTIEYLIAAVLLCIIPFNTITTKPYTYLRDTAVALCLPGIFLYWALYDQTVALQPMIPWIAMGFVTLWIIASIFAVQPYLSIKHTLRFTGIMITGLYAATGDYALHVIVWFAVASTLCSFIYQLKPSARTQVFQAGLTGNTNIQGALTGIGFFICVHILKTGFIVAPYVAAGLVLLAGLYYSRCRAAAVGVFFGTLAVFHWSLPLIAGLLLIALWQHPGIDSRKLIWKTCWLVMKIQPRLFGLGLYNSRPVMRSQYLEHKEHVFGFRRAHNDLIQMALDAGPFNALFYVTLMGASIWQAADTPYLMAALICVAINGLAFHAQSLTVMGLATWIVIGSVNAAPAATVSINPIFSLVVFVILIALVLGTWGRLLLGDLLFRAYDRSKKYKLLHWAFKIDPRSSQIAIVMAGEMGSMDLHDAAFDLSMKTILNYDGRVGLNTAYFSHAFICIDNNLIHRARSYLSEGAKYSQNKAQAKELIERAHECIQQKIK